MDIEPKVIKALSKRLGVKPLGANDEVREVFRKSYNRLHPEHFLDFRRLAADFEAYEKSNGTVLPWYVLEYARKISVPA